MANFDVFNGDADGLCAWLQWRLAHPATSHLVSGVKRDISLLKRVEARLGDQICVFDVSLDQNRDALLAALAQGATVLYVDHHFAGHYPQHPCLQVQIDTNAEVCSALIVNRLLGNRFLAWALVGAYGDNLSRIADGLAIDAGLTLQQSRQLNDLGIALNYNSYGDQLDDLLYTPQHLAQCLLNYESPFVFINEQHAMISALQARYMQDMRYVQALLPEYANEKVVLYVLPDTDWARRVVGVWGNELTNADPARAHAVLSAKAGGYQVSVRAPLSRRSGADELCRAFAGGGRQAAAGINLLPETDYHQFLDAFCKQYA